MAGSDKRDEKKKEEKVKVRLFDNGTSLDKPFSIRGNQVKEVTITDKVRKLIKDRVLVKA